MLANPSVTWSLKRRVIVRISKSFIAGLCIIGLPAVIVAQDPNAKKEEEAVSWQQAESYVGKLVTIEGRCINTRRVPGAIHLEFHGDFASHFRIVIPQTAVSKFQSDPLVRYKQRNLRVTGKVQVDRGVPYMKISDPKTIEIVPVKKKATS